MNEEKNADVKELKAHIKNMEEQLLEVHRLTLLIGDAELKRAYNILAMNLGALEQRLERLKEG